MKFRRRKRRNVKEEKEKLITLSEEDQAQLRFCNK